MSAVNADGSDLVKDERTLVYTSAPGYFGQDALTFEVTDGTGPDDPDGRKATLSIPINVLPPDNQPPTFIGGQMNVAPGEDATRARPRRPHQRPRPGGRRQAPVLARRRRGQGHHRPGRRLDAPRARPPSTAKKGAATTLTLRITDGETEAVEGSVLVQVTASNRAMPAANTDTIAEADQGKTVTVPVLANDFNPFPETPLKLAPANVETGAGSASVKGDDVVVTPSADFVGHPRGAIHDPGRDGGPRPRGDGSGRAHRAGRAGRSGCADGDERAGPHGRRLLRRPVEQRRRDHEVHGARSVQGGAYSKECQSTTCTLDGLTNNVEYVFQVTATNRVGESDPSGSSAVARPDARPDTPNPPTLTFGDKSLQVAWTTPTTPGSPVERYTLEISPAPPSGITQKEVTGNSVTWEGLENGGNYQVRVQAHNRAPEPSSWSNWSASEVPAGPPLAGSAPTTAELAAGRRPGADAGELGDAAVPTAMRSTRTSSRCGRAPALQKTLTPAPGTNSQAVVVPTSETAYTYRIRGHNKAGWGEWSAMSAPRRGVVAPSPPSDHRRRRRRPLS